MYTVVRLFGVVRFCIFLIKYIWEDIAIVSQGTFTVQSNQCFGLRF